MWWLVADEFGGIHLETLGQLAERGHAGLYLVALYPGDGRRGDAVAEEGRGHAPVVFRSEAEAEKCRAATGNNPEAEGWRVVPLEPAQLSAVIAMQGCTHVAMPEEWTGGQGGVDVFAAGAFVRMLEEAPPA